MRKANHKNTPTRNTAQLLRLSLPSERSSEKHYLSQLSQVPSANIQRSSFDRSHGHKTTFDAGYLYPIFCDEALPGDTFNLSMTGFARLATPIFPIMDNMKMDTQFFAVPIRLLWDNWQKFNGEQRNPGDSIDFLIPQLVSAPVVGHLPGSISDYMGIPTAVPDLTHSALWHRAYNLIYNEWYRDENLQNSLVNQVDDGPDVNLNYQLQRRGKRHDYFTSCLPWPQKGDSVELPLGDSAPVTGIGSLNNNFNVQGNTYYQADGTTKVYADSKNIDFAAVGDAGAFGVEANPDGSGFPNIFADLSQATAATINQLRQAFQIQRLLERDARGGTRYTEIIRSHFGVVSPDSRLQRPEFLGGGSSSINISAIGQTQNSDGTTPQGTLAGIGTAVLNHHGFTKSFTEHCIIIGLISVRADLTYQQGLNRMFSRSTRYDFYWPALSHIGEQAVLNKEIYAQGLAIDEAAFGFQERYAEYRYKPSIISGEFRSNVTDSLDPWHLSQDFANLPVLGPTFIEETPPLDRVVAVPDSPKFIFDSYFSFRCARPMPMYSVPGLIDHF
nr:MAG: major capsid protein [Microvirus sp.]